MYVIVLIPDNRVPVALNPIVESTDIILDPIETCSRDFVFGIMTKSSSRSL